MSSNTQVKSIELNNGKKMPIIGYGTFLSKPGEIKEALKVAVDIGYRHIDCAAAYENEKEIGEALKEIFASGKVKREDLWVTSKLPFGKLHPDEVIPTLKNTLKDLQLDYLDLYLIHMPIPAQIEDGKKPTVRRLKGYGVQDIWRQMEKAVDEGLAKSIGTSNTTVPMLNDMLNYAKIPPAVNQYERHPYFVQPELTQFCKENGVAVTAYSSLGNPGHDGKDKPVNVLDDETVKEIAKKHKKSAGQVLLRWSIEHDVICIPKSVNPERIKENFDIFHYSLTQDEVKKIDGLDQKLRSYYQDWFGVPAFC